MCVCVISVVMFDTLGILRFDNTLFLSSPHHEEKDLSMNRSCDDSLIGKETFMQTECLKPLQKQRARIWIQ